MSLGDTIMKELDGKVKLKIITKVGLKPIQSIDNHINFRVITTKEIEALLNKYGSNGVLYDGNGIDLLIINRITLEESEYIEKMMEKHGNLNVISNSEDPLTLGLVNKLGIRKLANTDEIKTYIKNVWGLEEDNENIKNRDSSWIEGLREINIWGKDGSETKEITGKSKENKVISLENEVKLKREINKLENKIKGLLEDLDSNNINLEKLNINNKQLEENNEELKNTIKELEKELAEGLNEQVKLEEELKKLEEKIQEQDKYMQDLEYEYRSLSLDIELMKLKEERMGEVEEKNKELIEIIQKLKEEIDNLEIVKGETELEVEFQKNLNIELNNRLQEISSSQEEVNEHVSKLKNKIEQLEKDIANKNSIIYNLEKTNSNDTEDLEKIKIEKLELEALVEKLKYSNESSGEKIQLLEGEIQDLKGKYIELELKNNIEKEMSKSKDIKIKELLENAENSNKINTEHLGFKDKIEFNGEAKIVAIIGNGSYGVTTTTVSIAKRLYGKKVLLIDLDLMNPKMDGILKLNPIIEEMPQIENSMLRTGLGALALKGNSFIKNREQKVFKRYIESKHGYVDYIGGIYDEIQTSSLIDNLEEFLNYVGNKYEYIVIDCGKLTGNKYSDIMQKLILRIAYRKIIISLNDKVDARNMKAKIKNLDINLNSNDIWILNFSDTSVIDSVTKRSIGEARSVIMPKDMQMFGSKMTFEKVLILRDRLSLIVEYIG